MSAADPALFAPGFVAQPYWWDRTPLAELDGGALPRQVDAMIVGSGYTGLNAALQIARGGRSTLVVDAAAVGFGCSTRNGGQVGTSVKPGLEALAAIHGEASAREILREGVRSLAWLGDFIRAEAIDCDFRISGRFMGAHSPRQYEKLAHIYGRIPASSEAPAEMVPRPEQAREIDTEAYHGGVVQPRHAALDPARYHRGLLDRTLAAGASIIPNCAVTAIEPDGAGFRVSTACGVVSARNVVVGTNGYTGKATQWLRRRVIPIGSYIIATEPIPGELMERLLPTDRMIVDTRKVIYYYRASPDRTRILFGGRVSWNETDPRVSAPLLHAEMTRIFPPLASTRVTHSWMGFVGFTFDTLMHAGQRDGVHYAAGYCGSGVGMASYLGMKLGLQVLGKPAKTAFDDLPFPSRFYYLGSPWFLAPTIRYYRWKDARS